MIYNLDKLKQILPVKSYQSMDYVINGAMDSSHAPKCLSCNGEKSTEMRQKRMVA